MKFCKGWAVFQRRNSHMTKDIRAEISRQVVRGKSKLKFSRFMCMSPGRRPSQPGSRGENVMIRPAATSTSPIMISGFPNWFMVLLAPCPLPLIL